MTDQRWATARLEDIERSGSRKRQLGEALSESPEAAGLLYNLACAEALLGEPDAALDHLGRAVAAERRFAEYARDDGDLASVRDDPRLPQAPS